MIYTTVPFPMIFNDP